MTDQPLFVTGNTFPVKDQLRALGCRWNADHNAWTTTDPATLEKANAVVTAGGLKADLKGSASPAAAGSRYRSSRRCRECKETIRHSRYFQARDGLCGECAFNEFDY